MKTETYIDMECQLCGGQTKRRYHIHLNNERDNSIRMACAACRDRYIERGQAIAVNRYGEPTHTANTMVQASYDYWMKLSDKHGGRAGIKRRMRAIDRKIDDLTRERDDLHAAHLNLLRSQQLSD